MSMGTTIISRAYPDIKSKIDFIIGEGYVTNTSTVAERLKELGKHVLLPEKSTDYQKSVNSIQVPLLILTASEDTITTYGDALALGNTLGENCTVVQFEGEHLAGFQVDYDNKGFGVWYLEQVDQFVKSLE